MGTKQIHAVEGLECRFGHANGAGVAFRQAFIPLVPTLPDSVVGHSVGPGYVVDEVLDESHFVAVPNHGDPAAAELR